MNLEDEKHKFGYFMVITFRGAKAVRLSKVRLGFARLLSSMVIITLASK